MVESSFVPIAGGVALLAIGFAIHGKLSPVGFVVARNAIFRSACKKLDPPSHFIPAEMASRTCGLLVPAIEFEPGLVVVESHRFPARYIVAVRAFASLHEFVGHSSLVDIFMAIHAIIPHFPESPAVLLLVAG